MGIRRVVTGHDANGKAVFASDKEVEPITLALLPGMEFYLLRGVRYTDPIPRRWLAAQHTYFPPVGGFRFGLFTVPPDSSMTRSFDVTAAIREFNEKLSSLGEHVEPDHPGLHRTATIDYEFIVSGRCVLELDNGAKRELRPGEHGHSKWHTSRVAQPYDKLCVIVVVLIGAHHDNVPKASARQASFGSRIASVTDGT